MNNDDIKRILETAIENLFAHQPNIFGFTPQTGQTEWNLAHHYANEIYPSFDGLDCDLDVVKHNYGNRRPDIIFHRRGSNEMNLLVVELKYEGHEQAIASDIQKLHDYWFTGELNYTFGAVVNLHGNKTGDVQVLLNPNRQARR